MRCRMNLTLVYIKLTVSLYIVSLKAEWPIDNVTEDLLYSLFSSTVHFRFLSFTTNTSTGLGCLHSGKTQTFPPQGTWTLIRLTLTQQLHIWHLSLLSPAATREQVVVLSSNVSQEDWHTVCSGQILLFAFQLYLVFGKRRSEGNLHLFIFFCMPIHLHYVWSKCCNSSHFILESHNDSVRLWVQIQACLALKPLHLGCLVGWQFGTNSFIPLVMMCQVSN